MYRYRLCYMLLTGIKMFKENAIYIDPYNNDFPRNLTEQAGLFFTH